MDFLKYITTAQAPDYNITGTTQNQTPAADPVTSVSGYIFRNPIVHITATQTTAGGCFQIPSSLRAGAVFLVRNDSGVSVNIAPPYVNSASGTINGSTAVLALATAKAILLFAGDATGNVWYSINTAQIGA